RRRVRPEGGLRSWRPSTPIAFEGFNEFDEDFVACRSSTTQRTRSPARSYITAPACAGRRPTSRRSTRGRWGERRGDSARSRRTAALVGFSPAGRGNGGQVPAGALALHGARTDLLPREPQADPAGPRWGGLRRRLAARAARRRRRVDGRPPRQPGRAGAVAREP